MAMSFVSASRLISFGTTFEATEITPLPPMPRTAEVRMSSPESRVRFGVNARIRVI